MVTLVDVAPDGTATELSGGAQLGSMRAIRFDIEAWPVFATVPADHRIRVVIGTGDVPHLTPPPATLPDLLGGTYRIRHDTEAASWIDLPVVGDQARGES